MKKIMFNDRYGLTQAVLEGKKTMTRRIIPDIEIDWNRRGVVTLPVGGFEHDVLFMDVRKILPDMGRCDYPAPTKYQPRYERGEELAVAQCYKDIDYRGIVAYEDASDIQPGMVRPIPAQESAGWTNKMFVRADLMEETIRITDIQLQRLNNITDEDCLKEGVEKWIDCYIVSGIMENQGKNNVCFDTPREAFAALIDRISGKGTWNRNPWVYVYTFELLR
ncbi:MAG: hypothetical protein II278_02545 [Bacteroidaceae bacterium]|nr:hypothetical protein [Bacteroidaceae bacterium]